MMIIYYDMMIIYYDTLSHSMIMNMIIMMKEQTAYAGVWTAQFHHDKYTMQW